VFKKVVVTGGCGFVGANLVAMLLERGVQVCIVDNLSRGRREVVSDLDAEIVEGDIRDLDRLEVCFQGAEAVIHLAAFGSVIESLDDPITNFQINAGGTLNVLWAARNAGVGKLVFASTGGALIGNAEPPVNEKSLPKPISPYGASKLCGEAYLHAIAKSCGLNTVATRFANVYGPVSAHKKGAVTAFMKAIMAGTPIDIYGDGSASRDYLHVNDLARGIILALETELEPGFVMHLASGVETTVSQLWELIKETAGVPEHPVTYHNSRRGEVARNFATYDLAREVIGFEPTIELKKGIKLTWDWYQEQGFKVFDVVASDS